MLPQAAIEAHVLFVVHGMDHRAGTEEQQRLEEGVGEQVEHRRAIGTAAGGEEHVAELRAGRISDHPLDVVLHHANGRGEQRGAGPNHADNGLGGGAGFEHRGEAADHEHAGGHHGGGVDQRGDRRGAFHGVGQPGVQAQLGGLAHRADEQQQAQAGHHVDLGAEEAEGLPAMLRHGRKDGVNGDGAEHQEGAENAERKAEIADAVDHERLDGGRVSRGLVIPEADEQI